MGKKKSIFVVHSKRPSHKRGYPWGLVAEAARANPGKWVAVPSEAPRTPSSFVKRADLAAFRPVGSFDAMIAQTVLYVSYLGEPVDPDWWTKPGADFATTPRHPVAESEAAS